MPTKFVIERDVPGAGDSTPEDIRRAAVESNAVLRDLGPEIQWIQSYVTDDKIYCIYLADDEDVIHEHARCVDMPAARVSAVRAVNEPSKAG